MLGWQTVCAVEWDAYAASVLVQRQNDKTLPAFPIWDDVQTFDGRPWRGRVDVVSGGFPCQDISAAGRGAGIEGERSGMWSHMARIIDEVRPRYAFIENSPLLVSRGLGTVLRDLAALGYDARWGIVGAHHVGAPHKRDRIWIVANPNSHRELQSKRSFTDKRRRAGYPCQKMAESSKPRLQDGATIQGRKSQSSNQLERQGWWAIEPAMGRVANGVAHRVDRIKALGNGQVPAVVRLAWETLGKKEQ